MGNGNADELKEELSRFLGIPDINSELALIDARVDLLEHPDVIPDDPFPDNYHYLATNSEELRTALAVVKFGEIVALSGVFTDRVQILVSGVEFRALDPDNPAVFDAYGQKIGPWESMLVVRGDDNLFKDIEVCGSTGRGVCITGDGNVLDSFVSHHHQGSGIAIEGGRENEGYAVVVFECYDPDNQGRHADAISISSGGYCYFFGALGEDCSDDIFDAWESTGNYFDECEAYRAGKDQGDGWGFKLGPAGGNTCNGCISLENRSGSFTRNGAPVGSNELIACTPPVFDD